MIATPSHALNHSSFDGNPVETQSAAAADNDHFADLIARISERRDRSAFVETYRHFAPRVKSMLLGKGMQPSNADDVLQEIMLAVWNKAGSYDRDKAAVSTWIFAIARNKSIDRLRREQRHHATSDEPDLRADEAMTATDEVFLEERKSAVHEALSALSPEQQEVVLLSFTKGLAHSEIAERLKLPLGTVKSRIRNALGHMRKQLGEFEPRPEECFDI